MSNHLSHLSAQWYPNRDNADWVLATIDQTEGPCYRKPDAMMFFSSQGHQLGMLSRGCLESDIGVNARKVMQSGKPMLACYDGSDEDDLSFHLGISCGGTIYIMLQRISVHNNYLSLTQAYDALQHRISGYFYQSIATKETNGQAYFKPEKISDIAETASLIPSLLSDNNVDTDWLATPIVPEPHLLLVGGGIYARPLVNVAEQLGWKVSLWDPRPTNARKKYFSNVDHIIKGEANILATFVADKEVDAAILMSHNVSIDAQALKALSKKTIQYLALPGPDKRKKHVISQAEINKQSLSFNFAGLASLFSKSAQSISGVLNKTTRSALR